MKGEFQVEMMRPILLSFPSDSDMNRVKNYLKVSECLEIDHFVGDDNADPPCGCAFQFVHATRT